MEPPITFDEAKKALFSMKLKRASGEDLVATEMLQACAEAIIPLAVTRMNLFVAGGGDEKDIKHIG